MGGILNSSFDLIINLYSSRVYEVADVIDTYVYREGVINGNFSLATAVGLSKSVVALVLILITNRIAKQLGHEGIW